MARTALKSSSPEGRWSLFPVCTAKFSLFPEIKHRPIVQRRNAKEPEKPNGKEISLPRTQTIVRIKSWQSKNGPGAGRITGLSIVRKIRTKPIEILLCKRSETEKDEIMHLIQKRRFLQRWTRANPVNKRVWVNFG